MNKMQEPLNSNERYLHGINVRLEVLIEQMSSVIEFIAKQNNDTVQENVKEVKVEEVKVETIEVKEEVKPKTSKRKTKSTL